ncbi:MAG TPA: ABC transporter ATP-binding protein [Desulfobacteraceae bacterium]|nr:ABC transporter ATP-binding protein [Desulfobacteraceae bacterium]HPJ67536.1 ABC transporter ATP-binding protein [Desulfobacteraceae bacterium]HPQ28499.1 ABC transporter ATP-binding protein [Desulfobacteraceae bacterium]
MNNTIIKVENLSKRYRIGTKERGYKTFREAIIDGITAPVRNFRRLSKLTKFRANQPDNSDSSDIIWALKDVSFEVKQGEVIGIIGRNGAGKSTLLKILSRITEPTSGEVKLYGRVSSLLEVGTGFHPELTGRENIYLNGAILGMRKTEIDGKFDEIVDFAEIEKFIDTPVKRYSSGMYVRLAFAVAAHLEPEILLVDEVLAVGDAAFQKKCLGKMGSVAEQGRTVLFVSHNMAAILSLCNKAYMMDNGCITYNGTAGDAVAYYMKNTSSKIAIPLNERTDREGNGSVRLTSIFVSNRAGNSSISCGDCLRIKIGYTALEKLSRTSFSVRIYDQFNQPIIFLNNELTGELPDTLSASGFVTCITNPINITPGLYIVNLSVWVGGERADRVQHAYEFNVEADDFYGTGKWISRQESLCLLKQEWRVEENSDFYKPSYLKSNLNDEIIDTN